MGMKQGVWVDVAGEYVPREEDLVIAELGCQDVYWSPKRGTVYREHPVGNWQLLMTHDGQRAFELIKER